MYSINVNRPVIAHSGARTSQLVSNSAWGPCFPFVSQLLLLVGILLPLFTSSATAQTSVQPQHLSAVRAAVLGGLPPLTDSADAQDIAVMLKRSGADVTIVSAVQAADSTFLNPAKFPLFIVPHSQRFPAMAVHNLEAYLRTKGRVLFLDGPAISTLAYSDGASWMPLTTRLASLPMQPMNGLSWKDSAGFTSWLKAADDPQTLIIPSVETTAGADGSAVPVLRVQVDGYHDWFSFGPPQFKQSPFVPGATITSFFVRGDETTTGMLVEWVEQDGSRWIASVPLSTAWRKVALRPEEFHYWPDGKSVGRGGSKDAFHPAAAKALRMGIARSHTSQKAGSHTFWLSDIGCSTISADLTGPLPVAPTIEGVSPLFKAVHDTVSGGWVPPLRDRGIGTTGEREARLRPARVPGELEAYPATVAGYSSWVRASYSGINAGAVWGGVSIPQRVNGKLTSDLLIAVAGVMQTVSIRCGGFEAPAYRVGESIQPACMLTGMGAAADSVVLRERLSGGKLDTSHETTLQVLPGESKRVQGIAAASLPAGEYRYEARLYDSAGKLLLDRVEMPVRVVSAQPVPAADADRVHVEGAEFVISGKPFRPVGINFWPLSVAGQEPAAYQRGWLSPEQYDADVIEQDLTRCESAGINLACIQFLHEDQAPAVIDFIHRCRNHHILVNVFVANADPRTLNSAGLNRLLDAAQLNKSADVFAFDIAWEPHLGRAADRAKFDRQWRKWIAENYGTIETAEADWGTACPRTAAGEPTTPTDEQLAADGAWRRLIAAYRRFVDEMIGQGYRAVTADLHPRGALIGARSGYGGNGFPGVDPEMPFDLIAGAAHLDFTSPEGYGLGGDWREFRAGGFTAAYARWAGNGAPVFWAEFGTSIYPGGDQDAERLAAQADSMDKMLRTVVDSGANGSAVWWMPGGLRIDEGSDFGIFNPDGTTRPSARRIRQHVDQELPASVPGRTADAWLTGNRDDDARGFTGLRIRLKEEYVRLKEQGKWPGFRTAGTGSTTADMPLVAVGGTPANGHNPLKFAQADLSIDPENPALIKAWNTGEATWMPSGDGRVSLLLYRPNGTLAAEVPLKAQCKRYNRLTWKVEDLRRLVSGKFHARLALMRSDAPAAIKWLVFGEQTPDM